jgi:hypothetical protein
MPSLKHNQARVCSKTDCFVVDVEVITEGRTGDGSACVHLKSDKTLKNIETIYVPFSNPLTDHAANLKKCDTRVRGGCDRNTPVLCPTYSRSSPNEVRLSLDPITVPARGTWLCGRSFV